MTLFQAPILTDGATHPAQQFRMMVRDLSNGAEGITQGDDLKVAPLGTPGAGVQVLDGSGIVRSKANSFGGSYSACNIGAATVSIASTGGSGRSDMVVLRILDPEYEGSLDPATDPVMFFDVISNVSSTATTVPGGYTAIPLARIDIPLSTSTITSGMIVDIRKVANPRRQRTFLTQSPTGLSTQIGGTSGTFSYFSTAAGWSVAVPDWASTAIVAINVGALRFATASFFGYLRATFGSSLTVQQIVLDDNQSGTRRQTAVGGDTLTIPSAYRGTTQTLRMQACGFTGNVGTVGIDTSSTMLADIEFAEAAR